MEFSVSEFVAEVTEDPFDSDLADIDSGFNPELFFISWENKSLRSVSISLMIKYFLSVFDFFLLTLTLDSEKAYVVFLFQFQFPDSWVLSNFN